MAEIRAVANFTALILMNVATRAVGTAVFLFLAHGLDLAPCASSYLGVNCDIPRAQGFAWPPHLILLVAAAAAFVVSLTAGYRLPVAPFSLFMFAVLVFCVGFDLIFQLPVRNFSRLFSSTFNLTSFIIFFSFVFVIAITPFNARLYWRFLGAMLQSYIAQDLAFLFYIAVQWVYVGMTSLYLMFVAFSFGAFTIHIMSIAGILRRSGELRSDDAVPRV
jgi:hypothetical protein